MEEHLDEEEIKIEYNESFETDPLCEQNRTKPIANCSFPVAKVSMDTEDNVHEIDNNSPIFSSHSSVGDLELDDLDYMFSETAETQIQWYREIDESGKYVCKFCDLTYSTTQTVRHHVKTKHPENASALNNIIKNNKRNHKIKCHICKQRFKLISNLKQHVKEHSKNLLRSCQECLATFNNDQEMIQHLHHEHNLSKTKTYSCLTCGYRTRKISHFKQHKNTHLQDKKLKCNLCDYSTNYLPNLKIHFRVHTSDKPYVCKYEGCGYHCAARSALRSHQLKHNPEENMLFCDRCTYKTVYRQSLKVHIESHNRNSLRD